MKQQVLEKNAWFRLLKVLYGAGWIVVVLITAFTFFITKPSGVVEMGKSGFTCPDGKSYTWKSYSGYYTKNSKLLEKTDHMSALNSCGLYNGEYLVDKGFTERVEKAKSFGYDETDISKSITYGLAEKAESIRQSPPYKLNWVTDETNFHKWIWSGIWTIVLFFVSYFILDTFKNIALYVFYGKRFTYPVFKFFNDN
jgi:hypothetical protein